MKKKLVPLLVTTEHKGVFFGWGVESDAPTIRLEKAQMCVYWSSECKGVLGLATNGPTENCKVGPAVPAITLRGVTSVTVVTDAAVAMWEAKPWK